MLKQQIQQDSNEALKTGEQFKLGVLRMLLAAITTKEKEKRYKISKEKPEAKEQELVKESELTDDQIIEVISSEIKKRKDAIVLYEKGNRPELADKEKKEIEVLQKYLPEQLSDDELMKLIKESIEKVVGKEIHPVKSAEGGVSQDAKQFNRVNAELRGNEKEVVLPILSLQSSVKERIPILGDFYKKIFEVTGVPDSIIDYACGLNPLTYFWMNLPMVQYKAFDIDEEEVDFLNAAFKLLGVKNVAAHLGDVLCDPAKRSQGPLSGPTNLESADVVFLLKLLPCLEHQKKNSGIEIIKKLKCKFVVVSFPVKSLGGKKEGMADFYSNNFKKMVESAYTESSGETKMERWEVKELLFDTELVFVIKK